MDFEVLGLDPSLWVKSHIESNRHSMHMLGSKETSACSMVPSRFGFSVVGVKTA